MYGGKDFFFFSLFFSSWPEQGGRGGRGGVRVQRNASVFLEMT